MGQAATALVPCDLDILVSKFINNALNWKQLAGLSYADFLRQISELNTLSNSFVDQKGKRLMFAVKRGTDESLLWKATVRVACCKIDANQGKVESYRLLNIKQFQKVYHNLRLQAEEMLKSYKTTDLGVASSSSSSCNSTDSSDYEDNDIQDAKSGATAKRADFKSVKPKLTASLILEDAANELGTDLDECCICFERKPEVILPCAHSYCLPCIEQWNVNSQTCPVCREDLKSTDDTWVISGIPAADEISAEIRRCLSGLGGPATD